MIEEAASKGAKVDVMFIDFIIHLPVFCGWRKYKKSNPNLIKKTNYIDELLILAQKLNKDAECPSHIPVLLISLARVDLSQSKLPEVYQISNVEAELMKFLNKWLSPLFPEKKGGAPPWHQPNLIAHILRSHFIERTCSPHHTLIAKIIARIFPESVQSKLEKTNSRAYWNKKYDSIGTTLCQEKTHFIDAYPELYKIYLLHKRSSKKRT